MKHRVLLLGLGFWGRNWIELISKTDRCELAGVAGAEQELRQIAAQYQVPESICFTDFREAIRKTQAEIAIIVIPGALHFEADTMALEHGMNVITEKPLAMNIEQAEQLLEAKAKHPELKFMASQNYRWRPHNQAIRSAIADGMIGDVEAVEVTFRKQEDLQGYRAGLEQPLLQDVCIHHFDLIRFFTGKDCQKMYCRSYRPSWSLFDGRPSTDAVMTLDGGVRVTYSGSWAARGRETSWDGDFKITGSKGCLTLDANDDVWFFEHKKNDAVVMVSGAQQGVKLEKPQMPFTEMAYGFHMMMDCIEGNTVPETTLEDNFKSYAMVCAGLASVESGMEENCK
ncbi:MAG: Gfo/Idh/MocA family oxidoreductase [Eubacteriales bacterium]|nr:Gfo/Idh/MocA family oxidoreductase [Eubacteriales bacterium]